MLKRCAASRGSWRWRGGRTALGLAAMLLAASAGAVERDADADIDTLEAAGNGDPMGIWTDGDTVWIVDNADSHVYAYAADGTRLAERDFSPTFQSDLVERRDGRLHIGIGSLEALDLRGNPVENPQALQRLPRLRTLALDRQTPAGERR